MTAAIYPPIMPVQICDALGNYVGPGSSGGGGAGGLAPAAPLNSTVFESSHVFASSAKSLLSLSAVIQGVSGYLMVFDSPGAPANGPVIPKFVVPVFSDGTLGFYEKVWAAPLLMSTGITVVYSSTGPLTLTLSATALFSGQVA